jgi:nitroimidazol reductase NimA-like FMN-containing flavoprotein (pyridoxamine 5'-phosphate oxidase superfamily)
MSSQLAMSVADREAFLAELHVGVLAVERSIGRPPLTGPVWYLYEPGGDVIVNIGASSQKAEALRAAGTASLCVQTEALPYKFVTVGGPVALLPGDEDLRRRIAARYLPEAFVEGYLASAGDVSETLTVRLTPHTWHSNDFSAMG